MQLPEPTTAAGRAGLAALLAEPARAVVAVDYDGTLAPIVPRPEDARPAQGAVAALAAVARGVGAVVIVTGRPVAAVLQLASLRDVPHLGRLVVLGHYGFERWDAATDEMVTPEVPAGVAQARQELPALLAATGATATGATVEDKESSLVVHTRRAADPHGALAALRAPVTELAERTGLELTPGRFVLELRPPGIDKGSALRGFVAEQRAGSVLFAGDDLGDLPAYAAVEGLRANGIAGVTVCSGSDEVPEVAERADLVVAGPTGVVAFMRALAAAIGSD